MYFNDARGDSHLDPLIKEWPIINHLDTWFQEAEISLALSLEDHFRFSKNSANFKLPTDKEVAKEPIGFSTVYTRTSFTVCCARTSFTECARTSFRE